jgi:hypothetical protein
MATDIAGLFGLTPEGLSQQRYQQDLKRGYELAQLSRGDAARATLESGVGQLGRGIAGLMGVEDPQMKLISARQQIMSQTDQTDPQSLANAAKQLNSMGDTQGAMALMDFARKAQSEMALVGQRKAAEKASLAQVAKTELSIQQEQQLRDELSKLPADATQEQILAIVTKYGSPDKVLASLQGAADKQMANQGRIEAARIAAEARIDAAREAGATRLQIAQMQDAARRDLAQMAQSFKQAQSEQLLTPKELQKREAAYPQATSALNSFETKADSFVKDIEKLRDSPGLSEITGIAAGRLPGITANGRAAQALYDKIVAKGGFQALQDLRDASKTGGALGNVSNQEGKQLTASFAAIDRRQDANDVKAALDQAIGDIQGSKTRLKEAYDMTYSYKAEQPKSSLSAQDQQALNWANSNPKDPRAAQIKNRLGVK